MSILSHLKHISNNIKHLTLPSKISYCKAIVKLYVKYLYFLYLKRKYKKRLLVVTYLGYSDWDKVIPSHVLEKRVNENKITVMLYGKDIDFYIGFQHDWEFESYLYNTKGFKTSITPERSKLKLTDMPFIINNPTYNSDSKQHTTYIFSISTITMRPASRLERELVE